MWGGSERKPDDSGGSSKEPPPNQELLDLKDQSDQQQVLIAQLKEMLRKSDQTALTKEKMDEYANTLTKINARVKKSKGKKDRPETEPKYMVDIPQRDKLNLLKQQMEANKVMVAERVKMVTQIKAQFDDSQLLINQTSMQTAPTEQNIVNYDAQSSSEDLYKILLNKEKSMTELTNKIQKLEANVLDLQENLKEKDSVIDARTKAITLMSENLSRKGKNTLDELDDTKEQMRKMQENFVTFETQIKIEKQKLMIDLEEKNNELCIFQSNNEKLLKENELLQKRLSDKEDSEDTSVLETLKDSQVKNEEYVTKINELTNTISVLNSTILELQNQTASKASDEKDEISKLKKQLDDSNKNMIKAKAQHKSKIKELTKKIENFRKISDINAEIVKLETENTKLNLKVAELEEEKGNLQLKIVEVDSMKDSTSEENVEELKLNLQEKDDALNENLETMNALRKKLEESEQQITELQEMVKTLSQLQNDQVKSEISSIDFEEKHDALAKRMEQLLLENADLVKGNEKLLTDLDGIKKEKQEVTSKLEAYMQENMELIDKLEKLSAEKVSSAESIEIVENLTQQEKLEIEAYQKRLDLTAGNIKTSTENIDSQDLNESVTQLNEETSELLQKIELFTIERREVMDKMENLSQENNQLTMKIKEIEVNKEMLADTYEQLQNEKEELDNKLEELDKQNKDLINTLEKLKDENKKLNQLVVQHDAVEAQENLDKHKDVTEQLLQQKNLIDKLNEELLDSQTQNGSLLLEIETLKLKIDEIRTTSKTINDNQELTDIEEEISNYKLIIEDNKNELISSSSYINELQNEIDRKGHEINNYKEVINNLNLQIKDLHNVVENVDKFSSRDENVELMSQELSGLKELLNENIKQTQDYKTELDENSSTINHLNERLQMLNNKIYELEELLKIKDDDLIKLTNELEEKDVEIRNLQGNVKEKDEQFHKVVNDFKNKYETLQTQIHTNSGSIEDIKVPFERKIQELEHKNKEQLEKMKKIAANLKKKSTLLQDLEIKYLEVNEKWQNEAKEKNEIVTQLEAQIQNNNNQNDKIKSAVQELEELQREALNLQDSLDVKTQEYIQLEQEFNNSKNSSTNDIETLRSKGEELFYQVNERVAEIDHLRNIIREYETRIETVMQENEILRSNVNNMSNSITNEKDIIISNLNEQLETLRNNAEIKSNAMQMKIQELEMFIETQDGELSKHKEKINKLIEGLGTVEKRRLSLEKRAIQLGSKLEEKSPSYEELSQFEDEFEQRFKSLKAHDELIEKQLEEATKEYNDLLERYHTIMDENDKLKIQLDVANGKVNDLQVNAENLYSIQAENLQQFNIIKSLEDKLKSLQNSSKQKLTETTNYCEKMEMELQQQQEEFYKEKKQICEQNEKLLDELTFLKESLEEYEEKDTDYKKIVNINNDNQKTIVELTEKLKEYVHNTNENFDRKVLDDLQYKLENSQKENEVLQQDLEIFRKTHEQQAIEFENVKIILEQYEKFINLLKKEKQELDDKIKTLCKETAEETVNNILTEAQQRVNENVESQAVLQPFVWPGQNADDPFSFIIESNKQEILEDSHTKSKIFESTAMENSQIKDSELLKKIKTLEFMLFNVEKEKDDALLQCHELCNEITRLIYDREKSDVSKNLESQIISAAETIFSDENRKELKNFQYQPVQTSMPQDTTDCTAQPVVEEVIQPKTSYLCYDDDSNIPKVDAFGENDDGWGFSLEEVQLTQEPEVTLSIDDYKKKLNALNENIRVLQMERENHLEEIKQGQIKSGKLLKKLKEFKGKNEQLTSQLKAKKSDNFFPDLDDAIQDELKNQITSLEKKIKEFQSELTREKHEKDNLNKRVEVLTSANERMVEMKEKQDIEIISWQRQNRDLQQKLDQLEWGDNTSGDTPKKLSSHKTNVSESDPNLQNKISELYEVIKELTLDNEELQTLLEEQRKLRIDAERNKSVVEPSYEDVKLTNEYMELQHQLNFYADENKNMQLKLEQMTVQYNQINQNYDAIKFEYESNKTQFDELCEKYTNICKNYDDIKIKHEEDAARKLSEIQVNYDEIKIKFDEKCKETDNLKATYDHQIEILNNQLIMELNNKVISATEIDNLKRYIQELEFEKTNSSKETQDLTNVNQELLALNAEKQLLLNQINEKEQNITEIANNMQIVLNEKVVFEEEIKQLTAKSNELTNKLEIANEEILLLRDQLIKKDEEFNLKLSITIEELNQQWNQRVDERGSDVAESWKLHLESRENEFMQIEQQLKKEINELEEKSNALVNENNELRKNVDTEIRNEVDRISALQQQINDRQQHINDLTRVVQEKQLQIEQQNAFIQEKDIIIQNLNQKIKEKEVIITGIENSVTILQDQLKQKQSILENHSDDSNKKINELKLQIAQYQENIITLQNELSNKQSGMDDNKQLIETLQQQLSDYNSSYSTLEQQLNEKDMYISEISYKLNEIESQKQTNLDKIDELQQKNNEYEEEIKNYEIKLQEKLQEIDLLNTQNLNYNQNNVILQSKEIEINNLKSLISEKENEYEYNLQQQNLISITTVEENHKQIELLKRQMFEIDSNNEEMISLKNAEIENLQLQLDDLNSNLINMIQQNQIYERVGQELQEKTMQYDDLLIKLNEQNILHDEETKQLTEMREILEEQTKTIEELKNELYNKSTDYDTLISQINMSDDGNSFKIQPNDVSNAEKPLESADRAELDLALYMLHQRDVRCEELTVELMQLLEERDTLQLRLSNAIKEKEELRSRFEIKTDNTEKHISLSTGAIPKSKTSAIVLGATGTELATEATEIMQENQNVDSLANKLSELKSVGYHKDKSLVDEQEYRRLQQLSILQQHKDDVSKLPPEAAARLVDASYTLSRDVQSPSKVLLNWLWGRSTPKVNEL